MQSSRVAYFPLFVTYGSQPAAVIFKLDALLTGTQRERNYRIDLCGAVELAQVDNELFGWVHLQGLGNIGNAT